jgi:hypothetical protein
MNKTYMLLARVDDRKSVVDERVDCGVAHELNCEPRPLLHEGTYDGISDNSCESWKVVIAIEVRAIL